MSENNGIYQLIIKNLKMIEQTNGILDEIQEIFLTAININGKNGKENLKNIMTIIEVYLKKIIQKLFIMVEIYLYP